MNYTARSKKTAAVTVVAVLAMICLSAAVIPEIANRYGLKVPGILSGLWRPVFWTSLAACLVITGRYLLTSFTYVLESDYSEFEDSTDQMYSFADMPDYVLGSPVYHSDSLYFAVYKKAGLGRNIKDFDMPVRSFVSCIDVTLRSVFPWKAALRKYKERDPDGKLGKLYDYTTSFTFRKAVLLVFSDGEQDSGILLDAGNPVSDYFRNRFS
ncbi:MAG: hypothetical protein IJU57_05725 [Clostridia bacterium]|nr:hypothetical protein [Clostridia bacterium]